MRVQTGAAQIPYATLLGCRSLKLDAANKDLFLDDDDHLGTVALHRGWDPCCQGMSHGASAVCTWLDARCATVLHCTSAGLHQGYSSDSQLDARKIGMTRLADDGASGTTHTSARRAVESGECFSLWAWRGMHSLMMSVWCPHTVKLEGRLPNS